MEKGKECVIFAINSICKKCNYIEYEEHDRHNS